MENGYREYDCCVVEAGISSIQVLGDYDRSPFSGASPALIVVGGAEHAAPMKRIARVASFSC